MRWEGHVQMKLLIAGDANVSLHDLKRALGPEFDVLTAATGEDALLRAELDHPDAVLCEASLPDFDGYDLCMRMKKTSPQLPFLLMTGIDAADRARGDPAGVSVFVEKPVDIRSLIETVWELVGGRPVGTEVAPPEPTPVYEPRLGEQFRDLHWFPATDRDMRWKASLPYVEPEGAAEHAPVDSSEEGVSVPEGDVTERRSKDGGTPDLSEGMVHGADDEQMETTYDVPAPSEGSSGQGASSSGSDLDFGPGIDR